MPWLRIAAVEDCPPGKCLETVAGNNVVALFNVDGKFHALDGVCPHQGGPLGQGHSKWLHCHLPLAWLAVRRANWREPNQSQHHATAIRNQDRRRRRVGECARLNVILHRLHRIIVIGTFVIQSFPLSPCSARHSFCYREHLTIEISNPVDSAS